MSKPVISEVKALNTIAQDTKIKGNIESDGDIRIDGILEGDLDCKGRVVVGPDSKINGTIRCTSAEIMGFIHGEIVVKDLLSLKASALNYRKSDHGKTFCRTRSPFCRPL